MPAKGQLIMLPLASINWKGNTQVRVKGVNEDTVSRYVEDMLRGVEFPPIVVFYDGKCYWPADGFHRGNAAHRAGLSDIYAEVRQGTQRDALLYGIWANRQHGVSLSNADKRAVVLRLLTDPETGGWSDHRIAREVGVDHKTVGNYRRSLKGAAVDGKSGVNR